jgi:squalene-associated FAD-dependent desaturase
MTKPVADVVGAGLAGMAAALALADSGYAVRLWEASPAAGGRCRSFDDPVTGRRLDNGNHLVMGANRAVFALLSRIDATAGLSPLGADAIPLYHLTRRTLGWVPLGIAGWRQRGASALHPADAAALVRLLLAGRAKTVGQCLPSSAAIPGGLWEALGAAVLNMAPQEAAAAPLAAVLRQVLLGGKGAARPFIAARSLGDSFVTPLAVALATAGVQTAFSSPVTALHRHGGRVTALEVGEKQVAINGPLVLAVPPGAADRLLPELALPQTCSPIDNLHFRLPHPARLPGGEPLLGLVGGMAQWIFLRGDIASVTISAAQNLQALPPDGLTRHVWAEIAPLLDLADAPLPPCRVVREKRATLALTPAAQAARPGRNVAGLVNLRLAGDWIASPLPPTIESAITSGLAAARDLVQDAATRFPGWASQVPALRLSRS